MKSGTLAAGLVASIIGLSANSASCAEIRVGVLLSTTGPNASVGIPYNNMFTVVPTKMAGNDVKFIHLNDGSDPSTAVRNARKLISEDNIDILVGGSGTPAAIAISKVVIEQKTPFLAMTPMPASSDNPWTFPIPQPIEIMMKPIVAHMKANGVKTVGYIGFSDAWGDLVYDGFQKAATGSGISVVANERYARPDTSVAGQVLKLLASKPDAVLIGGSGVPAALPQVTLVERGYKGQIYHNHGVVNPDFLRVGGSKIEGGIAPAGPFVVWDQLPDSNPIKDVSRTAAALYEAQFGAGSKNAFAGWSYDAYLLISAAVAKASKVASPGTPEFRAALRDSLEGLKEVVGTTAVYSMTPSDHTGVDDRSAVLVQVKTSNFQLIK